MIKNLPLLSSLCLFSLLIMANASHAIDEELYTDPYPTEEPSLQGLTVKDLNPDSSKDISPREGWGELEVIEEEEEPLPLFAEILLWPVNRVLDLVDVVRVDVGVGTSRGGVLRLTKNGNLGYRRVTPGSIRVGNFGRTLPFLFEDEDELGAGKSYKFSDVREVCNSEIGIGVDLVLGGYVGFCPEGIVDFLGGIIFLDPDDDDIR